VAKVLIVDDDLRTAEYVAKHLTSAGHKCTVETTGTRAVEALKQNGCDLLILDVMLPGVSGFEVCRRMRRDLELYRVPILIISAMGGEEEIMHGLAQGADDYVVKPFNMKNLLARVDSLLRTHAGDSNTDALTGLPGVDATKREIQRLISTVGDFALAYGELAHLREFARKFGGDARQKAVRWLGRALEKCGEAYPGTLLLLGHMGGGHFVCAIDKDKAHDFCVQAQKIWRSQLEELYTAIGHANVYTKGKSPIFPDVLFCVAMRTQNENQTPQEMFETLSQIRNKAMSAGTGGVLWDRRNHPGAKRA